MCKKRKAKKAAEAAAAQAALQQAQQEAQQPRAMTASFRVMNNCHPVPVARPADFIQLTPAVQPIPVSMYTVQEDAGMYNAGGSYADQYYVDDNQQGEE